MPSIEEEAEQLKGILALAAAGYTVGVAWRAAQDHLAGIIGFASEDIGQADRLCQAVAKDMAATIRRNWQYLNEERGKPASRGRG